MVGAAAAAASLGSLILLVSGQRTPWSVGLLCALTSWACSCLYHGLKVGPFSLPLLYLGVMGMFHLPLVPLVALGVDIPADTGWILTDSVGSALLLFAVACGSFVGGSMLQPLVAPVSAWAPRPDSNIVLLQTGVALWVVATFMLAVGAWQLNLFNANYAEFWATEADPRLFGVGILFALLASILVAVGAAPRWIPLGAAVFLAVLMPIVIFGFRGQVVVYCIAGVPLWYLKRPEFAKRAAAFALLAVVFGSPIIRVTRVSTDMSFREVLEQATPLSFLAETGYSLRALSETILLVDRRVTDLWMGASYVEAARRITPNLGTDRSVVQGVPTAPAHFLVYKIEPWLWKRGFGYGYSAVAEPYLNFGVPGVVGFFVLLGLGLSYCNTILGRNPYVTAWIGCAFGSLLWTARNDFTNFVRPAAWAAAIVLAAYVIETMAAALRRYGAGAGRDPPGAREPGAVPTWRRGYSGDPLVDRRPKRWGPRA